LVIASLLVGGCVAGVAAFFGIVIPTVVEEGIGKVMPSVHVEKNGRVIDIGAQGVRVVHKDEGAKEVSNEAEEKTAEPKA